MNRRWNKREKSRLADFGENGQCKKWMDSAFQSMKKRIQILPWVLFISGMLFCPGVAAAGQQECGKQFGWAAVMKSAQSTYPRIRPFSDGGAFTSEDRFRFYFQILGQAFFYLIHVDSHDQPALLFPTGDFEPYAMPSSGPLHMLPGAHSWYELEGESGNHSFYLIAAAGRLMELEKLFRLFGTTGEGEPEKSRQKILYQLQRLELQSRLADKGSERFGVLKRWLGGAARVSPEIMDPVTRSWTLVDFNYIYVKKLEFEIKDPVRHQSEDRPGSGFGSCIIGHSWDLVQKSVHGAGHRHP